MFTADECSFVMRPTDSRRTFLSHRRRTSLPQPHRRTGRRRPAHQNSVKFYVAIDCRQRSASRQHARHIGLHSIVVTTPCSASQRIVTCYAAQRCRGLMIDNSIYFSKDSPHHARLSSLHACQHGANIAVSRGRHNAAGMPISTTQRKSISLSS